MFQDVLLFEIFQQTFLILFYFHLNLLKHFPAKTCRSRKKRFALSQRREGEKAESGPLNNQSACTMNWKQAQSYNKKSVPTCLRRFIDYENRWTNTSHSSCGYPKVVRRIRLQVRDRGLSVIASPHHHFTEAGRRIEFSNADFVIFDYAVTLLYTWWLPRQRHACWAHMGDTWFNWSTIRS